MLMANETKCKRCGASLANDARDGVCLKCVQERLSNPYLKLRPWTDIEACACAEVTGLMLFDGLANNPIHCATCSNEVDPERLGLSVEEVEAVARWHSVNRSLNALWLDSGAYEEYAKAQLLDWSGWVNQKGMEAAKMLSTRLPTFVWLFRDCMDDDYLEEVVDCPVCGKPLDKQENSGWGKCLNCHVYCTENSP